MNTQVFDNPKTGRVSQWSFKWDDGNRRMPKYGMSGVTATKVMKSLQHISNVLFDETLDQESRSDIDSHKIRNQNLRILKKWASFIPGI
jgi:hypothetical protein